MTNKFSKGKVAQAVQKIKSWSYSRYAKWKECPQAAKFKFIDKHEETQGPAMARGERIGKLAEDYVMGRLKKLPEELKLFKTEFEMAKKSKTKGCEENWVFKADWTETHGKDWDNAWLRVKIDLWILEGTTLYIIDHKTGKNRGGYADQLELYAVAGFLKFPHVKQIETCLWFLDSGETPDGSYEVTQLPALKKKWLGKVTPMLNDTKFPVKSGGHCRWCSFAKSKGGPCKLG